MKKFILKNLKQLYYIYFFILVGCSINFNKKNTNNVNNENKDSTNINYSEKIETTQNEKMLLIKKECLKADNLFLNIYNNDSCNIIINEFLELKKENFSESQKNIIDNYIILLKDYCILNNYCATQLVKANNAVDNNWEKIGIPVINETIINIDKKYVFLHEQLNKKLKDRNAKTSIVKSDDCK